MLRAFHCRVIVPLASKHIGRKRHYFFVTSLSSRQFSRALPQGYHHNDKILASQLDNNSIANMNSETKNEPETTSAPTADTATSTNGTETSENKDESDNKRALTPSTKEEGGSKQQQPSKKKSKKEKKSFRQGYNVDVDDRNRPPQEGSFASEALRKQFGVDLDQNKIQVPDDQATVKRKVAILLGFLGTGYGGFQANLGQRTIQAEVELALYRAGLLGQFNFGQPNKYSFSMSARTDKGVHACAQVCSLKLEFWDTDVNNENNFEAVRKRIEERLPPEIRLLDIQRTTRNFCAKTQRDRVRYQYMIPSFLLHPDYKKVLKDLDIPMEGRQEVAKAPLTKEEIVKLKDAIGAYRSTAEERERLSAALAKYEGTHPFHNFTKGIKAGQASANRFIEFFKTQDPVIIDGVEWIPTQVLGQSFLLHQIRKMVSMAIDVARGAAPIEVMDRALTKTEHIRVHVAPAQGLFLEMSYFTGYNRRKQANPDLPDLDWNAEGPANERWSAFRDKIREHIVEEEKAEGNFAQYFYMQECIFEYRRFYRLDGNTAEDFDEGGSGDES